MKFSCHVEGNTLSRKELMTSCLTSNYIFPKGHISYKCHLRRQNNQDLLTLILFLYVHGKFPMDLGCVFHSTSNIYTSVFILDFNQTQISDFPSYIIKWSNALEELKGHKGKKKPTKLQCAIKSLAIKKRNQNSSKNYGICWWSYYV